MIDIADANVKMIIATGLVMIVALLTYIAFSKKITKNAPRNNLLSRV